MLIQQAELFWGTSMDFVKKFMETSNLQSFQEGDILFREGESATHFFILLKGQVSLGIGETGREVYDASKTGEIFGWSAIIGREHYSATAECKAPSEVLSVDRSLFVDLLEKEPENGMIFYKQLSATLGRRLLQSYQRISPAEKQESDAKREGNHEVIKI